jgi:hypothetical protein
MMQMARHLLLLIIRAPCAATLQTAEENFMDIMNIDVSKCERDDKEVVEGICLSLDMLKGLCLETMEECVAVVKKDY